MTKIFFFYAARNYGVTENYLLIMDQILFSSFSFWPTSKGDLLTGIVTSLWEDKSRKSELHNHLQTAIRNLAHEHTENRGADDSGNCSFHSLSEGGSLQQNIVFNADNCVWQRRNKYLAALCTRCIQIPKTRFINPKISCSRGYTKMNHIIYILYWIHVDGIIKADHSGRAVLAMNCLRPFKHWNRGFESHLRHDVCVHLFCVCVVLCAGSGLTTGWSPVRGVLPTV
jgi:hypothetical protein